MGVKSSSRPLKRSAKRGIALAREFMNPVDFPRTIPPAIFSIQIGGIAGGLQQACLDYCRVPSLPSKVVAGEFSGGEIELAKPVVMSAGGVSE